MDELCEVCKQRESNGSINIGIDMGIHLGKYGYKTEIYHKIEPRCVAIDSLYVCNQCHSKIIDKDLFHIKIMPQLKDFVKKSLLKSLIIEGLK